VSLCTTRVTCKLLRFPFSFRCLTCFFYSIHEGNSRICIGSLTTRDTLTTVFRCFLFFSSISILVGCMECFGTFFLADLCKLFLVSFHPITMPVDSVSPCIFHFPCRKPWDRSRFSPSIWVPHGKSFLAFTLPSIARAMGLEVLWFLRVSLEIVTYICSTCFFFAADGVLDYSFVVFGLRFQRGTCTDQLIM
jgi:hypothetical protein